MMHRYSSSQSNSFSMLFSTTPFDESDMYSFASSSSVDCTLSLGTPSTRLSSGDGEKWAQNDRRKSNFCWDILQPKHAPSPPPTHKTSRGNNSGVGGDPLLARRCANCDTTSTPLWRNGPRGPKSLCNACGIRFKKEERRAAAATASGGATSGIMESPHMMNHHSWVQHSQQPQKMPCFSPAINGGDFRFTDDDVDSAGNIPFLSWRLNVADRSSLVHDFTR
ncbi:hypothetical protein NMG60_11007979 [Bertholletia excelsa]